MFWKILISSILLFTAPVAYSNQTTQIEKEEINVINTGGGGGSSGGGRVYPRIEFPGRDVPTIYLGVGSGHKFYVSYLAGDEDAPAIIRNVEVSDTNIVEVWESEYNITLWGREYGEATVTVDVYHRNYDDIWVTTTIPVTVTQSVYIPK